MVKHNQPHTQRTMLEMEGPETRDSGPVTCLGMTFPNDEERRKHFLGILREKLKDPEFRKIEGFPIGSDENILTLSDPPYYTACPNPFIADFIKRYGKPYDPSKLYSREPFAADVSEGKNDPIYNAHTYHTKVRHKAIMRYILHYTESGDVIFDGFCGTRMAGVAARLCGSKQAMASMGYQVSTDGAVLDFRSNRISHIGARRAILSALSPIATFIESLRAKGKDRWYVSDPNKAGDLEKLRERSLLKELEEYRTSNQKRLKVFRLEAVRPGFKKAWQERDYATIITVARKVPENVLQEDPKLLMWYDQALTRSGEE